MTTNFEKVNITASKEKKKKERTKKCYVDVMTRAYSRK